VEHFKTNTDQKLIVLERALETQKMEFRTRYGR